VIEKIKNIFIFIGRGWSQSIRGKIGVVALLFALFVIVRMFFGTVSVQKFVMNTWKLDAEEKQLAMEKEKLENVQNHIILIQKHSPDYVEELGLKYLNIGDPNAKILKI
jgi:hypothetical protein